MTTAQIESNRDAALSAWQSALQAQSYTMNMGGASRSKTNQNVQTLFEQYQYWQAEVDRRSGDTRRVKFGRAQI